MIARRKHNKPRRGSLIVVGAGITGVGQTTMEAAACMERAEKLFYCVIEPTTELWIQQLNPNAVTLSDLYAEGKPRTRTYAEMTKRIVSAVREGFQVCAVFYGHPGVLVESTHAAIRRLRREGYSARMLPAVSADGCLFAHLGVNPGEHGMQTFEASDFLLFRRRFDPTSGLMLWQVGVLGESDARRGATARPERLGRLMTYLLKHYPPDHRVTVYYAPTFPAHDPIVTRMRLSSLPRAVVVPQAMLYVPPLEQRRMASDVVRWFTDE